MAKSIERVSDKGRERRFSDTIDTFKDNEAPQAAQFAIRPRPHRLPSLRFHHAIWFPHKACTGFAQRNAQVANT